jgi:peroxiredoxin
LTALVAEIHGISTQRSDQQSAFSTHAGPPFTLLHRALEAVSSRRAVRSGVR